MMIQQTLVTVWFLLSSLSICSSSTLPFSTIHKFNTREMQRDTIQEVDAVLLSTLYYFKRSERDEGGGLYLLQTSYSLPGPYSQLITSAVARKKEDVKENMDNMGITNSPSVDASNAVATTMIALTTLPTITTTTTTTTTTTSTTTAAASVTTRTTVPYPTVPPSYSPLSSPSSSSSCFSPACKWLASWHFIAVVSMTVTWLVTLMILYFLTRTAWGVHLLESCSTLCACDRKSQKEDQVLAKGIGYFDGSPGMRRFIFIEDEADDDEEDTEEENDTEREEDENRVSKSWKPPRMGTYILQEGSKKDVLEIGTFRLQEEDEEKEVNDKITKKKEGNEENLEYILDGEAYLLQSERVERQGIGEGRREGYEHIGGIEGMYGIVGREGVRGRGYMMIRRLEEVYGVGRGRMGESRYGRTEEIERLYEILKGEGTERAEYKKVGGGKRKEEDGVLMSVRELEGAVGGNIGEEKSTGQGRDSENWKEEREDIHIEQEEGSECIEVNKGAAKGGRQIGKIGMEQRGRERGERELRDTWEGRRRGSRANFIKAEEELWGALSSPIPKRSASFPMDHFLSSQLLSRKLSLIEEEETH